MWKEAYSTFLHDQADARSSYVYDLLRPPFMTEERTGHSWMALSTLRFEASPASEILSSCETASGRSRMSRKICTISLSFPADQHQGSQEPHTRNPRGSNVDDGTQPLDLSWSSNIEATLPSFPIC